MGSTKIEWATETNARVKRTDGYILVYAPSYPKAKPNGYVFEHRLLIARQLGRPLESHEVVHHKKAKQIRTQNLVNTTKKRRLPRKEILCACGCGQGLIDRDSKGRLRTFLWGHNQKGRTWIWRKRK